MIAAHPTWQSLFTRLLLQEHEELPASEVELYQAQPALGIDLHLTWYEALLPGMILSESDIQTYLRPPSAWYLARQISWKSPFPCCLGFAPQFLQDLDCILQDESNFFQQAIVPARLGQLEQTLEVKSVYAKLALARLHGDYEAAHHLVDQLEGEELQWNERGAQLWLEGNPSEAMRFWSRSSSVQAGGEFNPGLGYAHASEVEHARQSFQRAALGFDETTGWHHLCRLYLSILNDGSSLQNA
ncbi:MAG TPA: hypothetical protein PKD72_00255 [Gemmatales bacterium]|nr:hypothetical protein [Gemmatales bacterium]